MEILVSESRFNTTPIRYEMRIIYELYDLNVVLLGLIIWEVVRIHANPMNSVSVDLASSVWAMARGEIMVS